MNAAHLQYSTLQLQACNLQFHMCLPTIRSSLPVFDRGGVLDVTCESLSCLSRHPGSPPSGRPRTRDPLACAREGERRERESGVAWSTLERRQLVLVTRPSLQRPSARVARISTIMYIVHACQRIGYTGDSSVCGMSGHCIYPACVHTPHRP